MQLYLEYEVLNSTVHHYYLALMTSKAGGLHKLLIVDDEPDMISVMKIGSEKLGYEVDAFTSPQNALANFKPNYYHRIILDIRMPIMTGFELARQIGTVDGNAQICFLSSFEIHEYEARKVFPDLQSYCFITKPIMPGALAKHIETHTS